VNDILCRCGHGKAEHPKVGRANYYVCNGCFEGRIRGILQFGSVECTVYVPDNLKHIEALAKEKNLV